MNKEIIPKDLKAGDLIVPSPNTKGEKLHRLKFVKSELVSLPSADKPMMKYYNYFFEGEKEFLKGNFETSIYRILGEHELECNFELWSYDDLELVKYIEKLQFDDSVIFNDDISKFDLLEMIIQKAKEL